MIALFAVLQNCYSELCCIIVNNILFITKCKWELHLIKKVIIALLGFVAYMLRA